MNKYRRQEIAAIIDKLDELQDLTNEIKEAIENIQLEEQEYYDNMPEGLQQSDRGYAADQAVNSLEEAASALDDLDIDGIRSNLETAAE